MMSLSSLTAGLATLASRDEIWEGVIDGGGELSDSTSGFMSGRHSILTDLTGDAPMAESSATDLLRPFFGVGEAGTEREGKGAPEASIELLRGGYREVPFTEAAVIDGWNRLAVA